MSAKSEIVLSYHDSLIRKSDLALLEEGCWLNDTLIGFTFEYYEKEKYKEYANDVFFISPDVTQFIKFAAHEELSACYESLIKALPSIRLLFLTVNDNSSTDQAGGSHWSLLVYSSASMSFMHLDSSGDCNVSAAKQIYKKLKPFLKSGSQVSFETMACPQQTNSSDCGVYVISFVEFLCEKYLKDCDAEMPSVVNPESVRQKRHGVRDLILELSKSGQTYD